MPSTVNVNFLTIAHAGSTGTTIAFPDVCKTPTPAGPVPIPYPNIAMSSDTADQAPTVKIDGQICMVKGSNFRMSTGDEAGSALGVVSNKIKGKAEFVNYSFDVKFDGKNVCRLTDPMQQNMGSSNAFGPAEIQGPLVVIEPQIEACKETQEKQKQQEQCKEKTAWDNSGIYSGHKAPIQKVVDDFKVIIYFRATNHWCADKGWIPAHHKPKPHEVITAKTIAEGNVKDAQKFIDDTYAHVEDCKAADLASAAKRALKPWAKIAGGLPRVATTLFGVVMSLEKHNYGSPLPGYGRDSNGYSYKDKWITGDYDLMDIVYSGDTCQRPDQDSEAEFGKIKKALNKGMNWDGIQHGPQSQWVSKKSHGDFSDFSMPEQMSSWLKSDAKDPPKVEIAEGRKMSVVDNNLTVVAPNGAVIHLETHEDVKKALICCGCAR